MENRPKATRPAYDGALAVSMDSLQSERTPWIPVTTEDRKAVISETEHVLASSFFRNSKRYPMFLRYVVTAKLAGKEQQIKERTLGVEVFQRSPDYDTSADTVVRYTAGEVRKRLTAYYSKQGPSSSLQISLPVGSYIPEFFRNVNLVLAEPTRVSQNPDRESASGAQPYKGVPVALPDAAMSTTALRSRLHGGFFRNSVVDFCATLRFDRRCASGLPFCS